MSDTNWQKGNPPGSVEIPLAGFSVNAFEYKVNCGNSIIVDSASGTATITGQGLNRFTHRARDGATGTWTDWVDEVVRIDSGDPVNATPFISSDWSKGPGFFSVIVSDDISPTHAEWRVNGGSWNASNTAIVDGTGRHTLDTAAIDSAGNETRIAFSVKIDNDAPVDTTETAPAGWQPRAVDLKVDGTDADSGVDHVEWQIDALAPGSGPDGTIVSIGTQGKHQFRTRVVDEVGNVSEWRTQDVWINIYGPIDTTNVATTWYTDATVDVDITGIDNVGRNLARIEWLLDGHPGGDVSYPADSGVPVRIEGDGVHELKVRMTDVDNRVLDWHTHLVKIDTVNPIDLTTTASGWLPYSLNVNVHGADAHSAIQRVEWRLDGGNVESATSAHHDVTVAGEGTRNLETRVIDNAGKASAWVSRTIKLDASPPTNLTPVAPTGWLNTKYLVTLDGADALSGVATVSRKLRLEGGPETEDSGAAGGVRVEIDQDGTHTLSTRVGDLAENTSAWRTEVIRIDRVDPRDATVYPSSAVNNRHVITFDPQDDRSGVATVEWKLDGEAVTHTTSSATITGAGNHTLSVRVKDNARNWSACGRPHHHGRPPPDKTAPADNTEIPTDWLTGDYTVTLAAQDDIDGVGVDFVEWRLDGGLIKKNQPGYKFTVEGDGTHRVDTRVSDKKGNRTGWKTQWVKIDNTQPTDASAIAGNWANSRTITFAADDTGSGVSYITYDISGPSPASGRIDASSGTVTLATDGVYTITYDIYDVVGQLTTRSLTFKVDTVNPKNTSAHAPEQWHRSTLALPLSGTDTLSGVDRAEWRWTAARPRPAPRRRSIARARIFSRRGSSTRRVTPERGIRKP